MLINWAMPNRTTAWSSTRRILVLVAAGVLFFATAISLRLNLNAFCNNNYR